MPKIKTPGGKAPDRYNARCKIGTPRPVVEPPPAPDPTTVQFSQSSLEGADGVVVAVEVVQDFATTSDVRVFLSDVPGTAVPGTQYDWWSGPQVSDGIAENPVATIPFGQLTGKAYVYIRPSAGSSGAKTFQVRIDSATAADGSFQPNIGPTNQISVGIPDSSVAEPDISFVDVASAVDDTGAAHVVNCLLSIEAPTALTVLVGVTGTAVYDTDYTFDVGAPASDQISISVPAGASSFAIDMDSLARAGYQGDRSVILTLVDSTGYNLGSITTHGVRIAETEAPDPIVTFADGDPITINEGQATVIPILAQSPSSQDDHGGANIAYLITGTKPPGAQVSPTSPVTLAPAADNAGMDLTIGNIEALEDGSTFVIELQAGSGYVLGAHIAKPVTVVDVPVETPLVQFLAASDTYEQSDDPGSGLTVEVRREDMAGLGVSDGALSVEVVESATEGLQYSTTYSGGVRNRVTFADGQETATIRVSAPITGVPGVLTLTLQDGANHDLGTNTAIEVAIDVPITNQATVLQFDPIPGTGTGQQLVSYCFPIEPTEVADLPVYQMGPRACDVFPMRYVPGTTRVSSVQVVAPVGAPTGLIDFGTTGSATLPPTRRWEDHDLQNLRLVMDGVQGSGVSTDSVDGRMVCQLVTANATNLKKRYRDGIWITDEVYWAQFEDDSGKKALSVTTIATRRADRALVELRITIANDCYDPTLAVTAQDDVADGDFFFEKIVLNHQGLDTDWHFAIPKEHQADNSMVGTTTSEVVIVREEAPVALQVFPAGAMLHRIVGMYFDTTAGGASQRLATEEALNMMGVATSYTGPFAQNARRGWGPEQHQLPTFADWEYQRSNAGGSMDWSNTSLYGTEGAATFTGRAGAVRMAEDHYGKLLEALSFDADSNVWPDAQQAGFHKKREGWAILHGEPDPNVGGGNQFAYAWGLINHRFECLAERIVLSYTSQRQASHVTNINTGLPLTEKDMVDESKLVWGGTMVDKHVQSRWPIYVDSNADSAEPAPAGWAQKPSGPNADKPWQVAPGALPTVVQTMSDVQPCWDLDRYSPFPGTHFMRYARSFMPLLWTANDPWARWMLEHEMAQIERSFPSTAVDTSPASDQGLFQFNSYAPADSIAKITGADGGIQTQAAAGTGIASGWGGCVANNSAYSARMYRGTGGPITLSAHAICREPTGTRRTELLDWSKKWAEWADYVLSPLGIGDRFDSSDSSEFNFPDSTAFYGAHDFAAGRGAITNQWLVQKSWFTSVSAYSTYALERAAEPRPTAGPTSGAGALPVNALERHYRQSFYNLGVASGDAVPGAFQFVVSPAASGDAAANRSTTPGDDTFLPWQFPDVQSPYTGVADYRTVWHAIAAISACLDEKVDAGAYVVWLARILSVGDATIDDGSNLTEILASVTTQGRAFANGSLGIWELDAAYPYIVLMGLLEHMIASVDYGATYVGTLPSGPPPPPDRYEPNLLWKTTFEQGAEPGLVYDEVGSTNLNILKPDAVDINAARTWGEDNDGTFLQANSPIRCTNPSTQDAMIQAIKAAGAGTIEAWIQPANTDQEDPARWFSFGPLDIGHTTTNCIIGLNRWSGISDGAVSFRLRTSEDPTGVAETWTTADGVFSADDLLHVVLVFEAGSEPKLYVNKAGEPFVTARTFAHGGSLPTGGLEDWIDAAHLTLFNEQDGGVNSSNFTQRAGIGKFRLLAVHAEALNESQVALNHALLPNGTGTPPATSVSFATTASTHGEWETGRTVEVSIAPAQQSAFDATFVLSDTSRVSLSPTSTLGTLAVTIPAGASTIQLPIYPTQNATADGDVDVTLTISAGVDYEVGQGTHTLTIEDDDTVPEAGFEVAASDGLESTDALIRVTASRKYKDPIVFTIIKNATGTTALDTEWDFDPAGVSDTVLELTLPAHQTQASFEVDIGAIPSGRLLNLSLTTDLP